MNSPHEDLNTQLLDLLGVDWSRGDVIGVTLRLRANNWPRMIVHRDLVPGMPLGTLIQRFELTPLDEKPSSKTGH